MSERDRIIYFLEENGFSERILHTKDFSSFEVFVDCKRSVLVERLNDECSFSLKLDTEAVEDKIKFLGLWLSNIDYFECIMDLVGGDRRKEMYVDFDYDQQNSCEKNGYYCFCFDGASSYGIGYDDEYIHSLFGRSVMIVSTDEMKFFCLLDKKDYC